MLIIGSIMGVEMNDQGCVILGVDVGGVLRT